MFEIHAISTLFFISAILHTFNVSRFNKLAHRYPSGSIPENICHLLGEVEIVFVVWSALLLFAWSLFQGPEVVNNYLQQRNYTEPIFVAIIMLFASTRPVIDAADFIIRHVAYGFMRVFPISEARAFLAAALIVGPLLGSLITEPAAMTLVSYILLRQYLSHDEVSVIFRYAVLGVLFVNITVGGSLTPFAAPPVVMVVHEWHWDIWFMLKHFGWKAVLIVVVNTVMLVTVFRKIIRKVHIAEDSDVHGEGQAQMASPWWVIAVHLAFLASVVINQHNIIALGAIALLFMGFATATQEYQERLHLRQSLQVGGFLAGLITLGGLQEWWLEPIIESLGGVELYFVTAIFTTFLDNAMLTYLISLVDGLTISQKYFAVAGALAGGGVTVIANAPNPAGYAILQPAFGEDGIKPLWLAVAALPPTLVAITTFFIFSLQ